MEIAPGIHRIETPLGDRFVCLYLLVGSEHALLLDTGVDSTPTEYLAPYLDEIGLAADKIRYVVNSHADFDHTAGNQSAKELIPGALFMCHQLDLQQTEDIELMNRSASAPSGLSKSGTPQAIPMAISASTTRAAIT